MKSHFYWHIGATCLLSLLLPPSELSGAPLGGALVHEISGDPSGCRLQAPYCLSYQNIQISNRCPDGLLQIDWTGAGPIRIHTTQGVTIYWKEKKTPKSYLLANFIPPTHLLLEADEGWLEMTHQGNIKKLSLAGNLYMQLTQPNGSRYLFADSVEYQPQYDQWTVSALPCKRIRALDIKRQTTCSAKKVLIHQINGQYQMGAVGTVSIIIWSEPPHRAKNQKRGGWLDLPLFFQEQL